MPRVEVKRTASQIRETVASWRAAHETIALVPTMGNLHAGHLSLAQLATESVSRVVVSIFVNPTQFGVDEDFAAYPRTLDEDRALIDGAGTVDALFLPELPEVYPFGADAGFRLQAPAIAGELCGVSRPGHFDGVASVVLRLLNIIGPDVLVLGRKDYQQLVIIERMLADLRLPVAVVSGETRRDPDGLAISSRNRYLTYDERKRAPLLHAILREVRSRIVAGESDYAGLESAAVVRLAAAGFRPDYIEVRAVPDLARPNGRHAPDDLIVLGAAWLGRARLIDNLRIVV